jgi:tetratricopeptide (TPR) repeat protein
MLFQKRNFKVLSGLVLLFCFSSELFSQQQRKLDSLLLLEKNAKRDTNHVLVLYALATEEEENNVGKCISYAREALRLSEEIKYKRGILIANNEIGNAFNNSGQYDKAIEQYQKVIENSAIWGFPAYAIKALANTGNAYRHQGNYSKALELYFKALKENKDVAFKGGILNFIGMVYEAQADLKKARSYYSQALKVYETLNDSSEMTKPLVDLGNCYAQELDYKTALIHYKKALALYERENNNEGISTCLGNMGILYVESGDLTEAYNSFKQSYDISLSMGDKDGMCVSLLNLANFYGRTKNYNMAIATLKKCLDLAQEIQSKPRLTDAYYLLAEVSAVAENFTDAYNYHVLFTQYKDSILNEKNSKQIAQLQEVFESEKKEAELEKRNAEINKQTTQKIAFAIGLGLSVLLLFFVIRGYIQKRKNNLELSQKNKIIELQKHEVEQQKEIVEEKQKEILDSIKYARRIQKAMLPQEKYIDKSLSRIRNNKD